MGKNRYNANKRDSLHSVFWFIAAALLIALVFVFVIGVGIVSGVSMNDTLTDGELLIYTRINSKVETGQIVDVHLPTGDNYVKRVIAVGGDVIDLKDGIFYVNGVPEDDSCIKGETLPEQSAVEYPYTVPEDYVW